MKTPHCLLASLALSLPAFAGPAETLQAGFAKLAEAETLSIQVQRTIDEDRLPVAAIPADATVTATIQRPDKLVLSIESDEVDRHLYFDGSTLSIHDAKANVYASVEASGDLKQLGAMVEEKLGFTPPLADILSPEASAQFMAKKDSISDAGSETVDGVACSKASGGDDDLSWTIWMAEESGLPKKLVVGTKDHDKPALTLLFKEIDLAAQPDADAFTFTPDAEAKEAEIRSVDDLPTEPVEQ